MTRAFPIPPTLPPGMENTYDLEAYQRRCAEEDLEYSKREVARYERLTTDGVPRSDSRHKSNLNRLANARVRLALSVQRLLEL